MSSCDSATPDTSYLRLTGTVTRELPPIRADLPVTFTVAARSRPPAGEVNLVIVNRSRDTLFVGDAGVVPGTESFSSDVTVLISSDRIPEETTGSALVTIDGQVALSREVRIFPRR